MEKIRVGLIGLGARGKALVENVFPLLENIEIKTVCDIYEDRCADAARIISEKCGYEPAVTTDFNDIVKSAEIDAVIIMCSWEMHTDIAIAAMESGKAVGLEVGGAYSPEDCGRLVDTYEKTKAPFMFLENCCFGRRELMCLAMERQGVFGEVVHCAGAYAHDLRQEVADGIKNRHYRLRNYKSRNCDNYPTHDLGPIAKLLKINNGNRMVSLVSVASKAAGLRDYITKNQKEGFSNTEFRQGDIVTTVITCANGETITLTLDTTLPRYYSRGFTVRGTGGLYEECTDSVFLDRAEDREKEADWKGEFGNAAKYAEKYDHPLWQEYIKSGVTGTHDGMDYLEFRAFFKALSEGKPMPVDVYDAAAWMVITPLSEISIAHGGQAVDIPDFTRGKWLIRSGTGFEDLEF